MYLNFSRGNTLAQSLRAAPSKYDRSKLRPNFEQNEGQRLAEVFYPSKYLPVQYQDVNTEDWVVITKGKVVSALGAGEYARFGETSKDVVLPWPNASGEIPVYTNRSSTITSGYMDSSYWGYEESVCGLLVPCNGGADRSTASSYEYTANDTTAGTYTISGTVAAVASDITGAIASGNIPIGAAMYDIYQDIRGLKLNYAMWDKWGVVSDYFVTVPFVREGGGGVTYDTGLSLEATADDGTGTNTLRDFTYMTIPSGSYGRTGCTIKADARGNYVTQDPFDAIADIAGSTAAANPTVQTVGRLVTLDTRFPKDLLNYVDTYEGSQMAGTETGGLPYWLFLFAYRYLTATATTTASIYNIINAVKDGRFGMARIQLHIN
jgi:hypothetical protein